MADVLTLEIEGLTELIKTFGRYFDDIDTSPIILNAVAKIGKNVEARAKDILNEKIYDTPESPTYKRTGLLRARTISDSPIRAKDEIDVFVRSKQRYAPDIELGHRRPNPRPFLFPAGQIEMEAATRIMKEALTEFLQTKIQL